MSRGICREKPRVLLHSRKIWNGIIVRCIVQALPEGAVLGEHAEDNEAELSGNGTDDDPAVLAPLF